jgi:molecular chaperone DnaK (HSP70)
MHVPGEKRARGDSGVDEGRNMLIGDFGGGTMDFSALTYWPSGDELPLRNDHGELCGGSRLDKVLRDSLLTPFFKKLALPDDGGMPYKNNPEKAEAMAANAAKKVADDGSLGTITSAACST